MWVHGSHPRRRIHIIIHAPPFNYILRNFSSRCTLKSVVVNASVSFSYKIEKIKTPKPKKPLKTQFLYIKVKLVVVHHPENPRPDRTTHHTLVTVRFWRNSHVSHHMTTEVDWSLHLILMQTEYLCLQTHTHTQNHPPHIPLTFPF